MLAKNPPTLEPHSPTISISISLPLEHYTLQLSFKTKMAMILDAFISKFSELLMQMVQDEVGILLGIPGQIENLGETVCDIQCVLADAERKQSKNSAIQRWLMQLKDVMYDADDIIDLCQIKANARSGSSSHSSSNARCGCPLLSCFRNPFFAHEIGSKIKNINSRLEGIAKKKAALGLNVSQISYGPSELVSRVDSIITRKTDPSIVLDDIVGEKIEEDTNLLVNWLTKEEKSARKIIHVVAIVGMGGIGKTTLAKKIFNDPRIREEFQLKIWVCISKEVKGIELLKCVIREVGCDHGVAQERSELVPLLKSLIEGKKFLLILDDVWEESRAVWDDLLRVPMSSGGHGSRLLLTTRDQRVADGMKATKIHRVGKLSLEDGWSLLTKQVVQHDQNKSEIQEFKDIGLQLVEKCDGLPLAIKTIGGVLCTKRKTKVEWQAVLKSNMWSIDGVQSIHHAFHLSYEDLSSSLKQCFIFCSLYPEDFEFIKTDLIYQWLAEGFLQDKVDFWELGNDYYSELLVRNLLEATENFYDQEQYKMHDLLWSFAHQLGKDENCVLREGRVLCKPEGSLKVRRLSIEGNKVNTELIKKENGLRTLFLRDKPEIALDYLCEAFSNLRILDLSDSNFSSLPNSLCDLVHLRYLDVQGSNIENLPSSIGNLKYLVYLCLFSCESLSDVPSSIINLQKLKYLNTSDSGVRGIPVGLNKLDNLVHLYGFKPDKNSMEGFSSLDSIEPLSQLNNLILHGLEKVSDKSIAKMANLQNKDSLQDLKLVYGTLSPEEQLAQTNEKKMTTEDVLNELCPPRSLERLEIVYYFGSHLPNWLNLSSDLPNLRYLNIENCACFEELALLGQLPNLDYLNIEGAYSVVSVGEEFLWGGIKNNDTIITSCSTKSAFPRLRKLIFEGMPNWKEWEWNKGQVAMPKLKELFISDCPQLRSLPEGLLHHATSLEQLEISGANKMITIENLPSIKDIRVFENPNLERISNLPNISYILIKKCPNLKAVENLTALVTMELVDFEMETLLDYLRSTMPQKLRIWCSKELLEEIVSQGESGSEWNKFKHIPKVTIYSSGESFYAIYQKTPIGTGQYLIPTLVRDRYLSVGKTVGTERASCEEEEPVLITILL